MKREEILRKIYLFLVFYVLSNLISVEDSLLYKSLYSVLLVSTAFYFFKKNK